MGGFVQFILICMEMRSDFSMAQSDLQSIISGENLTIAEKFKNANNNKKWVAPMAAAGNMVPTWNRDGSGQGAMERRLVVVEFAERPAKLDSTLWPRLRAEAPKFIARANMAYQEMLDEVGTLQIWEVPSARGGAKRVKINPPLPDYFHQQKKRLAEGLNSLESFLKNGPLYLEVEERKRLAQTTNADPDELEREYRITWDHFLTLYKLYCRKTTSTPQTLTIADNYINIFKSHNLKRIRDRLRDPLDDEEKDEFWVIGCRVSDTGMQELASKK